MAAGRGQGQRPRVVKKKSGQSRGFYILLVAVAIAGGVAIASLATRAKPPKVRDADVTAAQAEGYLMGNAAAPVQVLEFADFECPACGQFSLVTEPDVRRRLVQSGVISYRFFDFPLNQHRNTIPASMAAACAGEQGKFWEMHDALFFNQPEWSSEATDNPRKLFTGYAKQLALNTDQWKSCMDDERYLTRILANRKEGERRQVQQTPTFVIGRKVYAGAMAYDQFKAYVDTATAIAAANPAPPPPPAAPNAAKKP
jgi:protein-disulfide isomerase